MFSSVVIATVVASAFGQLPKPCTYPIQFTAQIHGMNYEKNLLERAQITYDGQAEMVFEVEQFRSTDGHGPIQYENLFHYKSNVYWKIDQQSRSCYGPIEIPGHKKFSPFGVPKNSSFYAAVTEGVTPSALRIHEFGNTQQNADRTSVRSWHSVTEEECMPTYTHYFFIGTDGQMEPDKSSTDRFYNTVLGVEDPNVFIPPSNCRPASELPK